MDDTQAITAMMTRYQNALNASSTAQAMELYAEDGVFMAPNNQSAVGRPALRAAYDAVFAAITLEVMFTIVEILQVAPQWAVVRTSSAGTQTINATGAQSHEANQELFVLQKAGDGLWRIARYSFSTTNPATSA